MKHLMRFFLLIIISLSTIGLQAQPGKPAKLPIDPKVRTGKLPNGMTYYVRHNTLPKERADFYIVHKVGSIQEEENQRGLAHFLEHMAFKGSKNFPGERGIDEFTENIGMRLGENLNAYTGFDETVYMLMNAPVTKEEVIDSCLMVLHDWSGFLLLEDSAIDKERGVIREEWRTSSDAQTRLWEQQLPKMYPGCLYGNRLPIGSIDVINNFKSEELRSYYRKWYRPDLQAIIIVGDIDVDRIETSIKTMFSDIPAPVNAAKRVPALVPDNQEPLISIAKDKEATNIILSLYYKHDPMPDELKGTMGEFITRYIQQIIASIMSERFDEILQSANPPFIYAYAGDGEFMIAKTKEAWTAAALVKPHGIEEAMKTLVTETKRAKQFGFTQAEYDRARTNSLKSMESAYNERENHKNNMFAEEYVRNFTEGEYIPGIEKEWEMLQQMAPSIPIESINQYANEIIGEQNMVLSLMGPETDEMAYPSEAELLDFFRQAEMLPIEPYKEESPNDPLLSSLPKPGKIIKETYDPLFDATIYTLSNGVKVILKETTHKKDQILMSAVSPGGTTLFDDQDAYNLKIFNSAINLGGLGNFSATMLSKVLTGKNVSCKPTVGNDSEDVSGSTVPSDIRTLFELIYLTFTAPRFDEEAYSSFVQRIEGHLENQQLDPMVAFSDTITKAIYENQIRSKRLMPEDLKKISYDRIVEMYKERFGDASDFIFSFVGNIQKDSMIPMMEQYLATLPTLKRTELGNPTRMPAMRQGNYTNGFSRNMETPKAAVFYFQNGQIEYSEKNSMISSILNQILDLVYMEKVRENESGSYGVHTSINLSVFPKGCATIQTYFDTDPALKDKLVQIVKSELQEIAINGPRESDFTKTRENMLKRQKEMIQENSYWLSIIQEYYFRGFDWYTGYETKLNEISPADIQQFLKNLLDQGNQIEVIMEPQP